MIMGTLFALASLGSHVVVRVLSNAAVCAVATLAVTAGVGAPPSPALLQLKAELIAEIHAENSGRAIPFD